MSIWIICGLFLLLIEVLTTTFFIIFFGLAALSVALILVFFTISFSTQILLFTFISLIYVFVSKKIFKSKKIKIKPYEDGLIGQIGIVYEDCMSQSYTKVMIGDTLWKAFSPLSLHKGQKVRVVSMDNLTVEVLPL